MNRIVVVFVTLIKLFYKSKILVVILKAHGHLGTIHIWEILLIDTEVPCLIINHKARNQCDGGFAQIHYSSCITFLPAQVSQ